MKVFQKKLDNLFKKNPKLRKYFNKIEKNASAMPQKEAERFDFYSKFLWRLMQHFKKVLDSIDAVEECKDLNNLKVNLQFFSFRCASSFIRREICSTLNRFGSSIDNSPFCTRFD